MAVSVKAQMFTNDNGEIIKYDRLVVDGYIDGIFYEVEFKGTKNDMKLAQTLINYSGTKPSVEQHSGKGEVNATRVPAGADAEGAEAQSWLND